jgi:hypothetical protein
MKRFYWKTSFYKLKEVFNMVKNNDIPYLSEEFKRKEALRLIERWVLELEREKNEESNSNLKDCSHCEDELYG